MAFYSILFEKAQRGIRRETPDPPDFFADLNLDQIVGDITVRKEEYNLKPFFYTALHDVEAIRYRHEVMQDLENEALFGYIESFARKMHTMREYLAQSARLYYRYQKERWFLDAVEVYCDAVLGLARDLSQATLRSRGFLAFREYVAAYTQSPRFTALLAETQKLKADLATVRYCLLIKGSSVKVRKYEEEPDYSVEIEAAFEKFKQGAAKDYRVKFRESRDMNHVEARALDLVARLYPDIFQELDDYCARNTRYLDATIGAFDREVQFYVAYLEHIAPLKRQGLHFCYPRVARDGKEVYDYDGFDLALAHQLMLEGASVVCNDFHLSGPERIMVITGPNQGGKTTFARAFGQLHYLASLGCPVPGRQAQLFLFDRLFTHFEKEEDIQNLRGKLQDDLVRIRSILRQATPESIVIMNEIFSSTTLQDAIFLGKKVMERIIQLDLLCVCVTFVDELSALGEKTVSMVSTVVPENPTQRTFKIVRKQADGLSYAISIAEKYRLTYASLKERLRP